MVKYTRYFPLITCSVALSSALAVMTVTLTRSRATDWTAEFSRSAPDTETDKAARDWTNVMTSAPLAPVLELELRAAIMPVMAFSSPSLLASRACSTMVSLSTWAGREKLNFIESKIFEALEQKIFEEL